MPEVAQQSHLALKWLFYLHIKKKKNLNLLLLQGQHKVKTGSESRKLLDERRSFSTNTPDEPPTNLFVQRNVIPSSPFIMTPPTAGHPLSHGSPLLGVQGQIRSLVLEVGTTWEQSQDVYSAHNTNRLRRHWGSNTASPGRQVASPPVGSGPVDRVSTGPAGSWTTSSLEDIRGLTVMVKMATGSLISSSLPPSSSSLMMVDCLRSSLPPILMIVCMVSRRFMSLPGESRFFPESKLL